MKKSDFSLFVLFVFMMGLAIEVDTTPNPSFEEVATGTSNLSHIPVQNTKKRPAGTISPSIQNHFDVQWIPSGDEWIPSENEMVSLIDSWVSTSPQIPQMPINVEPTNESELDVLKCAGFDKSPHQGDLKKVPNYGSLSPSHHEHAESSSRLPPKFPRPLKRTRFAVGSFDSTQESTRHPGANGHPIRPSLGTLRPPLSTSEVKGNFASLRHQEHVNLPGEGSSGKLESGSASNRNLVQDGGNSSTAQLQNIDRFPIVDKELITREDWMTQQIGHASSGFLENMDKFQQRLLQLQSPIDKLKLIGEKRLNGALVIMTSVQGRGSHMMHFNRIVTTTGAYCELHVVISKFRWLVNVITCYHSELLKALEIDPCEIPDQNEALIKWLLAEMFHPSTGFPIIGRITNQKLFEALVKKDIENPFRTLDTFLSDYFGRLAEDTGKVACILINYWYPLEQPRVYEEFLNGQEHIGRLLKEIYLRFHVPSL